MVLVASPATSMFFFINLLCTRHKKALNTGNVDCDYRESRLPWLVTMTGYAIFEWSWTEVNVLGSQVFGQALMESSDFRTPKTERGTE